MSIPKVNNWTAGQKVKIGFCQYTYVGKYNGVYILENSKGDRYSFVPYFGIQKY